MKLVINVDNYKIEACKRRKEEGQNAWYHDMVLNGKSLEEEIVKELENMKNKLHKKSWTMIGIAQDRQLLDLYEADKIINDRISELKGETK